MNAPHHVQGRHRSVPQTAGRGGGGFFSAFAVRRLLGLLGQIDAGLALGSLQIALPDGSANSIGGRNAGAAADIYIYKWRALARIAWSGSVGFYQGWVNGEWDSSDPVKIFELFAANRVTLGKAVRPSPVMQGAGRILNWMRRNNKAGARRNIEFHYDLGNDFYAAWLDPTMTYSSAIFADPTVTEPLEIAQNRKINALLDRLNLENGGSLLEIGCGWGGLARAALQSHPIHYHGITLSHEQKAYADLRLAEFGARAAVSITDYRDVDDQYDGIVSVEMVEAVGQEYWPDYLDMIRHSLKPNAKAAIQYISIEDDIFEAYASSVDFIQRYIFPGGMLLSESRFRGLAQERGLAWCDQRDYGLHYAQTLKQWRQDFDAAFDAGHLPPGFDAKFAQLWRFYLMYCEGGFRGGSVNVAQVTLQKM